MYIYHCQLSYGNMIWFNSHNHSLFLGTVISAQLFDSLFERHPIFLDIFPDAKSGKMVCVIYFPSSHKGSSIILEKNVGTVK